MTEKAEPFLYPIRYHEYLERRLYSADECYIANGGKCEGRLIVSPVYVTVIDIEVSDTTTLQDIDKLKYVLFGRDTEDLGVNENITLLATVYMETPKKNGPTYPIAFTQKLVYEDREEEELTKEDIDKIKAFRDTYSVDNDLIKEFVKMFAPGVFGHDNIKEGILYMVTNAKPDKVEQKERLHGMIISEPGRAKTALLLAATKLMIKSTFETCQMATGLSLLFIVENREDMKITRTGPVARSLFASLDEFNRLSPEDQVKFLGGMQEGFFTNNIIKELGISRATYFRYVKRIQDEDAEIWDKVHMDSAKYRATQLMDALLNCVNLCKQIMNDEKARPDDRIEAAKTLCIAETNIFKIVNDGPTFKVSLPLYPNNNNNQELTDNNNKQLPN